VDVFGTQLSAPDAGEVLTYYQVDSNNTETLIGLFYAEPVVTTKNSYRFTAYDAASKLDANFSERLSAIQSNFPMTLSALVGEACTVAGVTLSGTFPMASTQVQAFYADGISCRQILSWAAEIACRFVRCNTSGQIVFDWYSSASDSIGPGVGTNIVAYKQDGLKYENYETETLDRVAVHPVGSDTTAFIYPTGVNTGNTLHIGNNALLTDANDTTMLSVAQYVYNTMSALPSYRPFSVELFPNENPFRAGQIISVTDSQGVSFTAVAMKMSVSESASRLESSGGETYSSDYNQTTALIATSAGQRAILENLGDQIRSVVTALDEKNTTYSAPQTAGYVRLCTKAGDPICTKAGDPILAKIKAPSGVDTDGLTVGDLWYNTSEDNTVYRWNGFLWESVADPRISEISQKLDSITLRVVGSDGVTSEIKLNDQGQINLLGSVIAERLNVDELFTRDITVTGRFWVNNEYWQMLLGDDGMKLSGTYYFPTGDNAPITSSIEFGRYFTFETDESININADNIVSVSADQNLILRGGSMLMLNGGSIYVGLYGTSTNFRVATDIMPFDNTYSGGTHDIGSSSEPWGTLYVNNVNGYPPVVKHTKTVSGTTTAAGNLNLGLAGADYGILSVKRTDANSICTPYVYHGTSSDTWYAHITNIAASPTAITNTAVTLEVDYYAK
jgi:hypothetical protein